MAKSLSLCLVVVERKYYQQQQQQMNSFHHTDRNKQKKKQSYGRMIDVDEKKKIKIKKSLVCLYPWSGNNVWMFFVVFVFVVVVVELFLV